MFPLKNPMRKKNKEGKKNIFWHDDVRGTGTNARRFYPWLLSIAQLATWLGVAMTVTQRLTTVGHIACQSLMETADTGFFGTSCRIGNLHWKELTSKQKPWLGHWLPSFHGWNGTNWQNWKGGGGGIFSRDTESRQQTVELGARNRSPRCRISDGVPARLLGSCLFTHCGWIGMAPARSQSQTITPRVRWLGNPEPPETQWRQSFFHRMASKETIKLALPRPLQRGDSSI